MYFKIYFFINHLFCLFIIFIFAGTLTFSKFIINIKKIRHLRVEIVLFLFFMCNFFF